MTDINYDAKVVEKKQISAVWLIPLIALLIGAWMVFDYVSNIGPQIHLKLSTAEGIEVGKTHIKSKNIDLGVIDSLTLNDDYSAIIATARMNPDARRMLKTDTRFWIVKPRIGKEGISGLETLLSGAYIELEPGSEATEEDTFTVLEQPPVAAAGEEGTRVVLKSPQAGKLGIGDPVLYEGFTVGRVETVGFNSEDKEAFYQLFIQKPYDNLVKQNSKFWMSSGIDMQLSAKGFNMQVGSIETLLSGGVIFNVPEGEPEGEKVQDGYDKFTLYDSKSLADSSIYDQYSEFVMLFDESIRGLVNGAAIEYRGIRIGTVVRAPLTLQTTDKGFTDRQIPVLVKLEIARMFEPGSETSLQQLNKLFETEFKSGLRATLKTGNLLTGGLFIDIDTYEDSPEFEPQTFNNYPVFPTERAGIAEIQKQLGQLVKKVNRLPLEETVAQLNSTLSAANKTLNSFDKTGGELEKLLSQQAAQDLPKNIQDSLKALEKTASGFAPGAPAYQELQSSMQQLKILLRELQPLARQLNDKPDSLIFGSDDEPDPIPAGGKK